MRKQGFTLIELLVVIAIIALLMGILMPALNKVKEQARGINCMSNQRTLAMAYTMYAGDNGGKVCGGWVRYDPINNVPSWVKPPLEWSGTNMIRHDTDECTLEQRFNGIRAGALYPYDKDVGAYHCPGDNRVSIGTSLGNSLRYAIYRSYSLPDYLRAAESADEKNLFNIKEPATKMLFVEEIYDGGAANFNHDGWSYTPRTQTLWDPLGVFHVDSATFSFMDGHADKKKWMDERTIIYFRDRNEAARNGYGKNVVFNPYNKDLDWLDEHYPGKTWVKSGN